MSAALEKIAAELRGIADDLKTINAPVQDDYDRAKDSLVRLGVSNGLKACYDALEELANTLPERTFEQALAADTAVIVDLVGTFCDRREDSRYGQEYALNRLIESLEGLRT